MQYHVDFDIEIKENPYKGLYIALEGIDGSGKTTQVEKLAQYFQAQGREVVKTHEPRRDGAIGELATNILQGKTKVSEVAIQYVFAAQRAVHQEDLIIPSLEKGMVVISDRCFWSAIPYGLLDRFEEGKEEIPDQLLASLSVLSMYHEFIAPDKTLVLDVPVEVASERLINMGRASEHYEKPEKLNKIKAGYGFLLSHFSENIESIDAGEDIEEVTQKLIAAVSATNK